MKVKRSNGENIQCSTIPEIAKEMFNRQWKNGDLAKFMASVKRRVKETRDIDLEFTDQCEFVQELVKYNLIEIIKK